MLNWAFGAIALCGLLVAGTAAAQKEPDEPRPVESVDLDRYAGLWYEWARIPNRFQSDCTGTVTAQYARRSDGRVDVINRCVTRDGDIDRAEGVARVVNPPANSQLEVSFFKVLFWRPFWGDYWVIGLDPDYRWAIVGTPDRKYGWVLGRSRSPEDGEIGQIDAILRDQGYEPEDFVSTGERDPRGR